VFFECSEVDAHLVDFGVFVLNHDGGDNHVASLSSLMKLASRKQFIFSHFLGFIWRVVAHGLFDILCV
jgi:hypothetical protein